MQSRESIPNVGRRAQGRKARFMLKGSSVSNSPLDLEHAAHRTYQQLTRGSLTTGGEAGDGVLAEPPLSYDESVLSQPRHPYNRIIQKIMLHHRMMQSKEDQEHTTSRLPLRTERQHDNGTASSSAPPHVTRHNHPPSSDPDLSKPRLPGTYTENDHQSNRKLEEAESEPSLQWADILTADCCVENDHLDLRGSGLPSIEAQSASSVDQARGYLTDRGLIITDHKSQGSSDRPGQDSLDTTRSEPQGISRLPRLVRKLDLQPLNDVLDYFWVYQGMSRRLLIHNSPQDLWSRKWFKKKPIKLPPLYISTGHKSEATSSNSTRSSRLTSEHMDTPGRTPRKKDAASDLCNPRCQQRRMSPVFELDGQAIEVRGPSEDVADNAHDQMDDNTSTCQTQSPEAVKEKGRTKRVTLVVKMPLLTQDSSSSDMLENE